MRKQIPVYLYGALIVFAGVFLMFSGSLPFNVVRLVVGITLIAGALIAFVAALSRQRKQVQFAYHEMHALVMVVYGVSVLVFCDSMDKLVSFTTFLLFFYTFSEIIFCNWLLNLFQRVYIKIIIVRVLLGLGIGVGVIIAINSPGLSLWIFGILFVLVGINLLLYVPVMKAGEPLIFTANQPNENSLNS